MIRYDGFWMAVNLEDAIDKDLGISHGTRLLALFEAYHISKLYHEDHCGHISFLVSG